MRVLRLGFGVIKERLYGVETKRINEAVRNNPDKFPSNYMFQLSSEETQNLRTKFSSTKFSTKSRCSPKVFTEKGLYMLATVLKSKKAVDATFAIIETFALVRTLKRELVNIHNEPDKDKQVSIMKNFGNVLSEVVMPDLETIETESSLELQNKKFSVCLSPIYPTILFWKMYPSNTSSPSKATNVQRICVSGNVSKMFLPEASVMTMSEMPPTIAKMQMQKKTAIHFRILKNFAT